MPLLAFIATAAVAFTGCQTKQEKVMDYAFSTEDYQWTDSVGSGPMASNVDIKVTAPKETDLVYEPVYSWIADALGTKASQEKVSIDKLIAIVGAERIDSIKASIDAYKRDGYEDIMPYTYTWRISPLYFTDQYVTYTDSTYTYEGGAHGLSGFKAATFTLADGKEWGYDMFEKNKLSDLRSMVLSALAKQYFKAESDSAMEQSLLQPLANVTLPSCPPYVTKDGIAFTYQQYEIAPYSEGMPSCVLSIFDVHNFLNPDFAKYVEE